MLRARLDARAFQQRRVTPTKRAHRFAFSCSSTLGTTPDGNIRGCREVPTSSSALDERQQMHRSMRALASSSAIARQMERSIPLPGQECESATRRFGFVAVLRRDLQKRLPTYLEFLTRHRIVENRPIISGNFVHQPAIKTLGLSVFPNGYPLGRAGHVRIFHRSTDTYRLSDAQISYLADIMLAFDFDCAVNRKVVLVTGGSGLVGQPVKEHVKTSANTNDSWIFTSSKDV